MLESSATEEEKAAQYMKHHRQDSIFLEQGKSIHQSMKGQKDDQKEGKGFFNNVTSMFKMSPSPN